jgi:hypothetical protein
MYKKEIFISAAVRVKYNGINKGNITLCSAEG